jgi:hypothetical protein
LRCGQDTFVGGDLVIEAAQDRTQVIFLYKKMRYLDALLIDDDDPYYAAAYKEQIMPEWVGKVV